MTETRRLEDWIGSRETATDIVTAGQAAGMAATLDWDEKPPGENEPLPPLWHWMFFAPKARQSTLGPDGHPARGGFMPPVPLPRRMFAGAHTTFHNSIRVGDTIRREGEVVGISEKEGRSGPLVFVRVVYRIATERGPAVEEEQTIVYREEPKGSPPAPPAADLGDMAWRRTIVPDPVLLFRYSALTFNGHRIHYDYPYAAGAEGYPGLVVHGPLIATLLTELARVETDGRPLASFRFRAVSPLFDTAPFTVAGRPSDHEKRCILVAANAEGGLAMEAEATFAA